MNIEKKMYLKGLVYDQLPEEEIVTEFIRLYVLGGQSLLNLQLDIALTSWPVAAGEAVKKVVRELEKFAGVEAARPDLEKPMSFAEMLGD